MLQLTPLFVYREPCPKFRSHIVSAIKNRNPYKLMRVMTDGKDSLGHEGMVQVLTNFITGNTPLKWEEITEDDVSFLTSFLKGIAKNNGKIKRPGNTRNKSKGFGLNRA